MFLFLFPQATKGPYTANASVVVNVQEINLYPPTFDITAATGYISEEAALDTRVTSDPSSQILLMIRARDPDLDPVSHMTYIESQNSHG